MSGTSLPLFSELQERPRRTRARLDPHLQAARQLSRRIARLPDQSPEQVRAGQLICRHLIAMLEETEAAGEVPRH